jgi:hypothetical protein
MKMLRKIAELRMASASNIKTNQLVSKSPLRTRKLLELAKKNNEELKRELVGRY